MNEIIGPPKTTDEAMDILDHHFVKLYRYEIMDRETMHPWMGFGVVVIVKGETHETEPKTTRLEALKEAIDLVAGKF